MSFREGIEKRGTRRWAKGQGPNQGHLGRLTRIPGERSTRPVQIRMTPTEYRDLEQIARDNLKTPAEVIRDAVNEYVTDYRDRRLFSQTRGAARPAPKTARTACDG